jgi:hypothetical protein
MQQALKQQHPLKQSHLMSQCLLPVAATTQPACSDTFGSGKS